MPVELGLRHSRSPGEEPAKRPVDATEGEAPRGQSCCTSIASQGLFSPTTRDFTAEAAENAENGRKQGNGGKTTGVLDSKAQGSSPFSACSAFSAVKK